MNRVMTMTVVRGQGECEAIVNGVVSAELKRQQAMARAKLDAEREEMNRRIEKADKAEARHRKMLAKRVKDIEAMFVPEKTTVLQTLYEKSMGLIVVILLKLTGRCL